MSIREGFHETYTEANIQADQARAGRLSFILDELGLTDLDVLDIGCGPGVQFTEHVRKNRFTGIDISETALEQARRNGYTTMKADVSGELPFPDASFDVVVMTDILEHVVEPLLLLKEAHRLLRKDGVAIISVPNHFFLSHRWAILRGKGLILHWSNHQEFEDWNYFHLRFFRSQSIRSMCAAAGFQMQRAYDDRFLAPLRGPFGYPIVRKFVGLIRRLHKGNSPDLWTLHFLGVYKKIS